MKRFVPFKSELLTTRDGKTVSERRETCWMADEGIGVFTIKLLHK
jgi:hypothetical protein